MNIFSRRDKDRETDEVYYENGNGEYEEYSEYVEYDEYAEYAGDSEYTEYSEETEEVYYEDGNGEYEEYVEYSEYSENTEYAEESDGVYYEDGNGEYEEYVEYSENTEYAGETDAVYYEDDNGEYYEYASEDDIEYYGDADEYTDYDDEEKQSGIIAWFRNMTTIDKVMLASGVCILILAVVTGVVFINSKVAVSAQASEFAALGTKLEGIEVIGDEGLLALADAAAAKKEAAKLLEQENDKEYDEADYSTDVTVELKMVSVQKDLKIKFVNKKSGKLIANVPFIVSVTSPDGKSESWNDDDMDGIIYKKGITPGNYKVEVNALTGDKYSGYTLPAGTQSVEVKKDIAYKKIDVSDEVKTESQVNVATEEQKKQQQEQESSLTDTVEWVESTAVTSTYIEVSRNNIPDPMTLVMRTSFMRMANEVKLNKTSAKLQVGGSDLALKAKHSLKNVVSVGWSTSDSDVAEVDSDGVVTAVSEGTATITCTVTVTKETNDGMEDIDYEASCEVTVEGEVNFEGTVSVNSSSVTLTENSSATVQISTNGFEAGRTLKYSVSSDDTDVATAKIDNKGKITIKGVGYGEATVTASVNYKDKPLNEDQTIDISVTVTEAGTISLDKSAVTVYVGTPVTINASLKDGSNDITAKSSDKNIATVKVKGKSVEITGVKPGTANVTVSVDGGNASAVCAVTVKQGAEYDKSTLLKDNSGNQLYVHENDSYREAVYADYYKDGVKFFKRGETKYTGWQTIDGKVYFFDASGKKVTGEQVIQGAKYTFGSDGALITGSGTMGIDVSKHNGTIDWAAVKNSGVSYVIIRCGYRGYTQGSLIIDPKFEQNIKGATAAGLKVGVYFFSQAVDEVEAVEEASFVLDAVKGYKISYPIYLDVEYSGAAGNKGRADGLSKSARTSVCKAFCETIRSGGYTAGVYANRTWLETMLDPSQISSHKIWLAQYAAAPTYKGRYDMWQYKSTGKVSGITGNVDMNLSYLGY